MIQQTSVVRRTIGDKPRVPAFDTERKLSESESTVAGLPTFVDSPAFDDVYPRPDGIFILRYHEIIEAPAHDAHSGQQAVIRTVEDIAVQREPVEDESRAPGLFRERVEMRGGLILGAGARGVAGRGQRRGRGVAQTIRDWAWGHRVGVIPAL